MSAIQDILDKLYANCGGLLQQLAKIWLFLCTIAGLGGGVICFIAFGVEDDAIPLALFLLLVCPIGGFLVGWISSVALYAFGVIVENVEKTRNNLFLIREQVERIEKTVVTKTAAEE